MNILFNIPNLSKKHGGVYQYSIALLKIIASANLPFQFVILCNQPENDVRDIVINTVNFKFSKIVIPHYPKPILLLYKVINIFFKFFRIKKRLNKKELYDRIIKDYYIDIIHTPTQAIINRKGIKSITTLHDVQELHFPEFFTSEQRAYRAVNYRKAINNADAVIVSYNHVRDDIHKYFAKPLDKIHTVLLDMQSLWFENLKPSNNKVLDKFKLPTNFLLYPASTWEHKNHINLIKAIKQLDNPDISLICTGHPNDHFTNKIEPLILKEKLETNVIFLGIVTDVELFELYHNCRAVVVPTLYEAGSFPLMESILMGIPVVCSNVTSLPETIGNNRFVFDPNNINDIADKIIKIWDDENYRSDNKSLLKNQADFLKNNNASSKIKKIYEDLLNE